MAILDFHHADIIMTAAVVVHTAGSAGIGIGMTDGNPGYFTHAIMHADYHAADQGEVSEGEYGDQYLFHEIQNYNVFSHLEITCKL